MKTVKESALWAWSNVSNRAASPLLVALGEAIELMPDDDDSFAGNRHMSKFAKRIGSNESKAGGHVKYPALRYSSNWSGEWEVLNSDLIAWGYFKMWLFRCEADRGLLSITFQDVSQAIGCKRLFQAYERYQKTGLTQEHCSLLANMGWEMDMERGDWISLHVQGKRPMGNSSISNDIYEHAGWEMDWPEDDGMSPTQEERAWNLFDELVFAASDAPRLAGTYLDSRNSNIKE